MRGGIAAVVSRTIEEMLRKMESFSHTEYNEEKFRNKERIVRLIRHGKDLWGRWSQWYRRVNNNQDYPAYLKLDGVKDRFAFMLDRDGENAGFVDYTPPKPNIDRMALDYTKCTDSLRSVALYCLSRLLAGGSFFQVSRVSCSHDPVLFLSISSMRGKFGCGAHPTCARFRTLPR